jgi:hypothetical protein
MKEKVSNQNRSAVRGFFTWILVALAIVAIVGSTIAVWAQSVAFNSDRFMAMVDPITDDPQIIEAVSEMLSRQITETMNLQDRLVSILPKEFSLLAAPAVNLVRGYVKSLVQDLLSSETLTDALRKSILLAHDGAMAILQGNVQGILSISDGKIVLNLYEPVVAVLRSLQESGLIGRNVVLPPSGQPLDPEQTRKRLSDALGHSLPEGFGTITLFESSALAQAQQVYALFYPAIAALIILAVLLTAGAFLLAPRRRSVGIVLGTLLAFLMLILNLVSTGQVNQFIATIHGQAKVIVKAAVNPLLSDFQGLTIWLMVAGIALALIFILVGWQAAPWRRKLSEEPSPPESASSVSMQPEPELKKPNPMNHPIQ